MMNDETTRSDALAWERNSATLRRRLVQKIFLLASKMKTPRKVSTIPLERLWQETDWIDATRGKFLTLDEITSLIGNHIVPVAIASIMAPIYWPIGNERFAAWKLIKPLFLDGTQDEWITDKDQFYVASIWHSLSTDYILFEHHH
jgi:hypothetical protein